MSNIPNSLDSIIIPEKKEKLSFYQDRKIKNCAFFKIEREDHTLGNIIHSQLLKDENVLFCGYKRPHPLEHFIIVKIITTGKVLPIKVFDSALKDLYIEFSYLEDIFKEKIK
mmetsp:Transcript_83628/g.125422  ORF Transcript_83628/g.125422 Transcript_83628/m.125422 type:complete len:112 (-) Transcript_83628:68-403(-)